MISIDKKTAQLLWLVSLKNFPEAASLKDYQ
jgi:hypothetical protein